MNVRENGSVEIWGRKVQCFRYKCTNNLLRSLRSFAFFISGMPWNSKLNSFERSSCMIAALRFSVAYSWSSVSRLASLLSRFSIFSWATSKLVSTAVIRRFRLDSICARRLSTDWSNWNTSFSVGSLCAFCAIGFLECLKVTFSMKLQATALTRSSLLLDSSRVWLSVSVFTIEVYKWGCLCVFLATFTRPWAPIHWVIFWLKFFFSVKTGQNPLL